MDSDSETDDLMAQTMGFSSFGGQSRPQKKRRYNPRADAAQGPAPLEDAGTGANTTALGATRSMLNVDEIGLDDEDNENPSVPEDQGLEVAASTAAQAQVRPAGLPQRPAPGAGFIPDAATLPPQQAQPPSTGHNRRSGYLWYEGYYDPMSNENPWERLEKAKGLESKGSWLPRGSAGGGP